MDEGKTEETAPVVDLSGWRPINVPVPQLPGSNEPVLPILASHPAVIAVCNILMYEMPSEEKAWHSPAEHARTRDTMEQCISHLILQRRPTAGQDWIDKLPEVARRIERNLYYSARSIDEYSDPYTLVTRIQSLVKVLIAAAANRPLPRTDEEREGEGEAEGDEGEDEEDGEDSETDTVQKSNGDSTAASGLAQSTLPVPAPAPSSSGPPSSSAPVPPATAASSAVVPPIAMRGGAGGLLAGSAPSFAPFPQMGLYPSATHKPADLLQAPLYLMPLKEAEYAQEQAAAAAAAAAAGGAVQTPMYLAGHLASRQVSSQGCSRVFIIKVLISVSEFVKGKALPSIFTFKRELVMTWLIAAKQACCLPTIIAEEGYYGGPPFVDADPSTHWSEPHQLYTWWKNNVERRSKFKVLQEDAKYKGLDPKRLQRARWCEAVVALSEVIRASSGSSNASRNSLALSTSAPAPAPAPSSSVGAATGAAGGPFEGRSSLIAGAGAGAGGGGGSSGEAGGVPQGMSGHGGSDGLGTLFPGGAPSREGYPAAGGLPVQSAPAGPVVKGATGSLPGLSEMGTGGAKAADGSGGSSAGSGEGAAGSGIDALISMSNQASAFLSAYSAPTGPAGPGLLPPNPLGTSACAPGTDASATTQGGLGSDLSAPGGPLLSSAAAGRLEPGPGLPMMLSGPRPGGDGRPPVGLFPGGNPGDLATGLLAPAGSPFRTATAGGPPGGPPGGPSHMINGSHLIPGTNIPYRNYSNTFPVKLFDLVSSEDEAVVGWQGHGTSFQVRNMDKFVNEILPKHFKHNNFTSFQRQLNLYGFRRSASYDKGAYYHPQFQQGQRELAESIRRVLVPNSASQDRAAAAAAGREAQAHMHLQHQHQHQHQHQQGQPQFHGDSSQGFPGMGMNSLGLSMALGGGMGLSGMQGVPGMPPLHSQQPLPGYPGGAGMSLTGLGLPFPGMSGMPGYPTHQLPTSSSDMTGPGSAATGSVVSAVGSGGGVDGATGDAVIKTEGASSSGADSVQGSSSSAASGAPAPAPLPLPGWVTGVPGSPPPLQQQPPLEGSLGQTQAPTQAQSPFNNSVYWQTLAINNMGTSLTGLSHTYFLQQHMQQQAQQQQQQRQQLQGAAGFMGQQYPGYPQYGGYPVADGSGAYDPALAYAYGGYGGGPYGVMSQLARNFYSLPMAKLKPTRSYKRSKRSTSAGEGAVEGADGADGAATGSKRPKLSARDRKLQDMMHSADGGLNAEQFLAGTMLSDRYKLEPGGSSYRRKKGDDDAEGAVSGKKGRGRPRGRRAGDEGTYQDGEGVDEGAPRGNGRGGPAKRAKGSRRRGEEEDSDNSSASQAGYARGAGGSRRLGRGGGSSRNLVAGTPDHFLRSGLSKYSSLVALTEGAAEDLLDLRNPRRRRVHVDFTLPAIEALVSIRGDPPASPAPTGQAKDAPPAEAREAAEEDGPDYVCGFYHGELHVGNKDRALHYKLHGSRALPEALLRASSDLQSAAASTSPARAQATMIVAQNDNAPRNTRVGEDFQCDVPAWQPVPVSAAGTAAGTAAGVARRSTTSVTEGLVWRPGQVSEVSVDAFLELLRARKALVPVSVGSVLVVRLISEGAYRLCCVLDVHLVDPSAVAAVAVAGVDAGVVEQATAVRVFDGYEDFVVSAADCMTFEEGEMEAALLILASHNGELSPALVQEVDLLVRNERTHAHSHSPTLWSSEEVQQFCSAVHRYGDNIKKVWELKFRNTKRLEEVYEFFLRIYPHTQLGGAKRVVHIYHRSELAAAGFPDGEQSDSSEEEGEEEDEEEEEDADRALEEEEGEGSENSSVKSISAGDPDAEDEGMGEEGGATLPARQGPGAARGSSRRVKLPSQSGSAPAAVKPSASSSALSTASSTASARRAAGGLKLHASSSAATVAVQSTADTGDRRSSRKRGSSAGVVSGGAGVEVQGQGLGQASAGAEESKRRRR